MLSESKREELLQLLQLLESDRSLGVSEFKKKVSAIVGVQKAELFVDIFINEQQGLKQEIFNHVEEKFQEKLREGAHRSVVRYIEKHFPAGLMLNTSSYLKEVYRKLERIEAQQQKSEKDPLPETVASLQTDLRSLERRFEEIDVYTDHLEQRLAKQEKLFSGQVQQLQAQLEALQQQQAIVTKELTENKKVAPEVEEKEEVTQEITLHSNSSISSSGELHMELLPEEGENAEFARVSETEDYYALGKGGHFLDLSRVDKGFDRQFRLTVINEDEAAFELINHPLKIQQANTQFEDSILPFVELASGSAPEATTKVNVLQAGTAVKEAEGWVVKEKCVITYC
ncbi:hypothetical protein [Algivirga pacifica]|uniref:Uncharacterized protein n=1 Tax=Algivirga pacifica TaxID=1162670 RepID=A0ABP9D7H8_9BACT